MSIDRAFLRALITAASFFGGAAYYLPSAASDLPVKHVDLGDARIAYVEQGQGEPVVLVHGAVSDLRTWERQREILARNHRVISYTQRYFGTAPWNKDWPPFGVATHANDLAAFIEKLGIAPAHVVGWSYGAAVVLALAQQHPTSVKSAFAFEPPFPTWVANAEDKKAIGDASAMYGKYSEAVKAGDGLAAASALLDAVEGGTGVLQTLPPELQAVVKDNARTLTVAPQPPPQISCDQLGKIKPGVTIARGEKSVSYFRLVADSAARCMPQARHLIVPGGTHLWPGNDPAAFGESVASAVKGN